MSSEELEAALRDVRRLESELDAARQRRDRLIADGNVIVETAASVAPLSSYILVTPRRRHAARPDGGTSCGRQGLRSDEPLPVPTNVLLDVVTCEDCRRELTAK